MTSERSFHIASLRLDTLTNLPKMKAMRSRNPRLLQTMNCEDATSVCALLRTARQGDQMEIQRFSKRSWQYMNKRQGRASLHCSTVAAQSVKR